MPLGGRRYGSRCRAAMGFLLPPAQGRRAVAGMTHAGPLGQYDVSAATARLPVRRAKASALRAASLADQAAELRRTLPARAGGLFQAGLPP